MSSEKYLARNILLNPYFSQKVIAENYKTGKKYPILNIFIPPREYRRKFWVA
jgi:hypothetical protein